MILFRYRKFSAVSLPLELNFVGSQLCLLSRNKVGELCGESGRVGVADRGSRCCMCLLASYDSCHQVTFWVTNFGLNLRHGRVARLKVSCFQSGCSAVLIEAVWSLVFEEWFA